MVSVFFYWYVHHRYLHSFPTRRSSDLIRGMRCRRSASSSSCHGHFRSGSPWLGGCSAPGEPMRSEEHTSELQSQFHLVCRLLLEKKNKAQHQSHPMKHGRAERTVLLDR